MKKLTWLACIVTVALTLFPAQIAGALARYWYELLVLPDHEGGLLNWITADWYQTIAKLAFPDLFAGMVAGGLSLCSKVFRRANYKIVTYVASGVAAVFVAMGLAAFLMTTKLNLPPIANGLGVICGLYGGFRLLAEDSKSNSNLLE